MDVTTRRLIERAKTSNFSNLGPEQVHETRRRLIDSVACALGAWHDPLCASVRAAVDRMDGPLSAAVWGCTWRTSQESAAFINGTTVRVLDLSDAYRVKSGGHPSDVIAAVLAVADAVQADGKRAFEAINLAYDVYCSFCESVDVNALGWDQPVYGVIGSVMGAAKLLGLDADQMGHAIGLAVAPNLALTQTRKGTISMWKGAAGANAARNAVFAARLAQNGVTGPSEVFEGAGGLQNIIGAVDWNIEGESRLPRTSLKRYPVCYHGQGAVDAALHLRNLVRVEDIAGIHVHTYAQAITYMAGEPSRWCPTTRETADHSLPYVVASALLDGSLTSASYDEHRLSDPTIARLMACTRIVEEPDFSKQYPASAPCRITIELRNGERQEFEIRSPLGHSDNPLSDAALEDKFMSLSATFCRTDDARTLLGHLWRFDEASNVRELLSLIPTTVPDLEA